jgi:hypothetical protein
MHLVAKSRESKKYSLSSCTVLDRGQGLRVLLSHQNFLSLIQNIKTCSSSHTSLLSNKRVEVDIMNSVYVGDMTSGHSLLALRPEGESDAIESWG